MSDEPEQLDGSFYSNFKAIWNRWPVKLPLPEGAAQTAGAAFGGVGAMIPALKVAQGRSFWAWWKTAPSLFSAEGVTTIEQLWKMLPGVTSAAYGGLYIATLVLAAVETYGEGAYAKLTPLVREVERHSGQTFDLALRTMFTRSGLGGAQLEEALMRARSMSDPKLYRRPGVIGRR